jgi:hypothetical protein
LKQLFIEYNHISISIVFSANKRRAKYKKNVYLWLLEEKEVIYSKGHCPVELSPLQSYRQIKNELEQNEKMVNCFFLLELSPPRKTNSHINLFRVIFNAIVEKNQYSIIISLFALVESSHSAKKKYKFFTENIPENFPSFAV